jgi:hypothetical protein
VALKYGRNQKVKGGVKKRATRRLKRTGPVKGVKAKDGITGREARLIRKEWRAEGKPGPKGKGKGKGKPKKKFDPLKPELDALDRLQFGSQVQELDLERRRSDQHTQNLTGWYDKHVQDMQMAQVKHQAFQQGMVAAQNQAVQTAFQADTGALQQQQGQAQQQAAQLGMTVDPSVYAQAQQAAGARQTAGLAGTNMLAQQGSAQAAYMGNQVAQGSEQGLQARQDQAERSRALDGVARELAADRGAARVKNKTDLQEMYWKRRLEEAVFGLEQQEQAFDQADDLADNRRGDRAERRQRAEARRRERDRRIDNRRQNRAEQRQQRNTDSLIRDRAEDNARQRAQANDVKDDGRRNGSSFTPTQRRSGRRELRELVGAARSAKPGDKAPSGDPLLIKAAAQIARNGGVTPDLARKIRRNYGFTPKIRRTNLRGTTGNTRGPNGESRPG